MLVLSRKIGEEIVIEVPPSTETRTIVVQQVDIRRNRLNGDKSRLGVAADKDISVDRREVWEQKHRGEPNDELPRRSGGDGE